MSLSNKQTNKQTSVNALIKISSFTSSVAFNKAFMLVSSSVASELQKTSTFVVNSTLIVLMKLNDSVEHTSMKSRHQHSSSTRHWFFWWTRMTQSSTRRRRLLFLFLVLVTRTTLCWLIATTAVSSISLCPSESSEHENYSNLKLLFSPSSKYLLSRHQWHLTKLSCWDQAV